MMRRRVFGSAVVVLVAGYLFRAPLLGAAGALLIDEDAPVKADAIVVLAGAVPQRALEAAALYREGYAPRIVFSRAPDSPVGRDLKKMGVNIPLPSQIGRSIAEQLGVPSADIVEVGGTAESTFTEAEVLLRFALAHGYHTILLVTSKAHTRRAGLIFRHLSGGRCRILVRPSRYDPFQPDSWWHDRTSARRVVFEYEKLAVFFLLDRWRLAPLAMPREITASEVSSP